MVEQLTFGIITTAALLDSINPCVFGVLIFLLAYMTTVFHNKWKMLVAGMIYITTVYITYFLIGVGLLSVAINYDFAIAFYWIAAIIAILAGIIEMKDYFWYGKWFTLQMLPGGSGLVKKYSAKMKKLEKTNPYLSLGMAVVLGFLVVLLELPCTGAPYLAIIGLLTTGDIATGIPLLLYYNLIFILPLFFIVGFVWFGKTSKSLENWRKEHRGVMRLIIGLFLIALGAYMIYSIA